MRERHTEITAWREAQARRSLPNVLLLSTSLSGVVKLHYVIHLSSTAVGSRSNLKLLNPGNRVSLQYIEGDKSATVSHSCLFTLLIAVVSDFYAFIQIYNNLEKPQSGSS